MCDGVNCRFDKNVTREHLLSHIRSSISTTICYEQIDLLPRRADLIDVTIGDAFRKQVEQSKPIIFMPNSIVEKNIWSGGANKYHVYIFGILPCGSKTLCVLKNIPVFFDVMVPPGYTIEQTKSTIRGAMNANKINFTSVTDLSMTQMHEFHTSPSTYVRIHFDNLKDRKDAIQQIEKDNVLREANNNPIFTTASDDLGSGEYYYNKVAREYQFFTADWNRIDKYEQTNASYCQYNFEVDINDYKPLDEARRNQYKSVGILKDVIDKDPLLVKQWDIETYSNKPDGSAPDVDDEYDIFNICNVYFHHWSTKSLYRECIILNKTAPREGMDVVIECKTEKELLRANYESMGRLQPDVTSAFNGSAFDWPLYIEKLKRNSLLCDFKRNVSMFPPSGGRYADTEQSVAKWCFQSKDIKIDAENTLTLKAVANIPGILDIDVSPIFVKLYPRAEVRRVASLNFYLVKNKIATKEDMPYKRMFRIYKRSQQLKDIHACHCGDMTSCACCNEWHADLDYKPSTDATKMELIKYSNELYDELVRDGKPLCCHCGKRNINARDMADIGYYCTIDCIRPQELCVKRMIMADKRELSNLSFVSLSDSFYRADGMKVRNFFGKICYDRGIAFSNRTKSLSDDDKPKYPGAWVFVPNRGLHASGKVMAYVMNPDGTVERRLVQCRPITGLDFSSLYPSIMMTNNYSPDRIVKTKEEAERLANLGYTIHHIEPFEYTQNERTHTMEGWCVRHNGILNNENAKIVDCYEKIVTIDYEIDGQKQSIVHGIDGPSEEQKALLEQLGNVKTTRRVKYEPVLGRDALSNESMGVLPFMAKKLFDMRVPIKKKFVHYGECLEELKNSGRKTMEVEGSMMNAHDIEFNMNKVDAKQKALKVLVNTSYGESGNFRSPIYQLLVAAGITTAGQKYIKSAADFVMKKGYIVHYGDTDSIYITCPDALFAECDQVYENAMSALATEFDGVANVPEPKTESEIEYKRRRVEIRRIWWTKQVEITMKTINSLREEVVDHFMKLTNTLFLVMAYEEVLFPSVLAGKKKYYGNDHLKEINFDKGCGPNEHFVKGIDVVKQGQAPITKDLGYKFMQLSILPENELELIDLAIAQVRSFYSRKHDIEKFVLNGRYKPNKKNVPVQTFVRRMNEKFAEELDALMKTLYTPPEPGDKFEYIIAKKNVQFTLQGRRIEVKKGDQMEYINIYKASQDLANPLEIDLNYYMKSFIIGLFARFIAYHPNFQPEEGIYDLNDKEGYKSFDQYCIKQAAKFLEQLCDEITGYNRDELTQTGRDYRSIYGHASKQLNNDLAIKYGTKSYLFRFDLHGDETTENLAISTRIIKQMQAFATACANKDDSGKQFIEALGDRMTIYEASRLLRGYSKNIGIIAMHINIYNEAEKKLIGKLYDSIGKIIEINQRYEKNVINLIEDMRKVKFDKKIALTDEELVKINGLTDAERSSIDIVYNMFIELISINTARESSKNILRSVESCRVKLINDVSDPGINIRRESRNDAKKFAQLDIIPEYSWT